MRTCAFRFLLIVIGTFVLACNKKEPTVAPANVSFPSEFESIDEDRADPLTIKMQFSAPPNEAGSFLIDLTGDAIYNVDYTTDPSVTSGTILVNVENNVGFFEFGIMPINNTLIDGDREINLSIANATGGVSIGSPAAMMVLIRDNNFPVGVSFLFPEVTTNKFAQEQLAINFDPGGTNSPGSFEVAITSDNAAYGTDFITNPPATDGVVSFEADFAEFTKTLEVIPDSTKSFTPPKMILLTLQNGTDGVAVVGMPTQTINITE